MTLCGSLCLRVILEWGKNKSRKNSLYGRYTRCSDILLYFAGAAAGPGVLFAGLCACSGLFYAGSRGFIRPRCHWQFTGLLRALMAVRAAQLCVGPSELQQDTKKARHNGRTCRSGSNSLRKSVKYHNRQQDNCKDNHCTTSISKLYARGC